MPKASPINSPFGFGFQVGDIVRFTQEVRRNHGLAVASWLKQEPLVVKRLFSDGVMIGRLNQQNFTVPLWEHTGEVRFNADRFELDPFLDAAKKANNA